MKPLHRILIPLGLAGSFSVLALAIEPPEDKSPPPAPPAGQPEDLPAPAAKAEEAPAVAAYLGLGVADLPEVLAAHLGLEADGGVVVRAIDPRGPAAKAGIAQHDVITRIGGQAVASHADLTREVQRQQPGAEIAIDFIHRGKPATKSATLVPRPDGAGIAPPEILDNLRIGGMPEEQAARIRKMIERQLKDFEGIPGHGADRDDAWIPELPNGPKDMDKAMREMRKRMEDAMKLGPGADGGLKIQGAATFRMMNPDGSSVELNSKDGGKEATIRDKGGKVTWTGPWDTEQDKAAAPPEVRAALERLNIDGNFKGGGIRLRFGNGMGLGGLAEPAEPAEEAEPAEPAEDDPKDAKPNKDEAAPPPPAPEGGSIR